MMMVRSTGAPIVQYGCPLRSRYPYVRPPNLLGLGALADQDHAPIELDIVTHLARARCQCGIWSIVRANRHE